MTDKILIIDNYVIDSFNCVSLKMANGNSFEIINQKFLRHEKR